MRLQRLNGWHQGVHHRFVAHRGRAFSLQVIQAAPQKARQRRCVHCFARGATPRGTEENPKEDAGRTAHRIHHGRADRLELLVHRRKGAALQVADGRITAAPNGASVIAVAKGLIELVQIIRLGRQSSQGSHEGVTCFEQIQRLLFHVRIA